MTSNTIFSKWLALRDAPIAFEALPSQVSAGVPLDLTFTVRPWHESNQLIVRRRSNGRECPGVHASPDFVEPATRAQCFRVRMPPLAPNETAEYSPVLTRAGLLIHELPVRSTRGVQPPPTRTAVDTAREFSAAVPRYDWASEFLGAFTVKLVNESFGPCADGMHI